ncbi:hypothetical protein IWX65_003410 [Arthrobacter sp. CAN_A214]
MNTDTAVLVNTTMKDTEETITAPVPPHSHQERCSQNLPLFPAETLRSNKGIAASIAEVSTGE